MRLKEETSLFKSVPRYLISFVFFFLLILVPTIFGFGASADTNVIPNTSVTQSVKQDNQADNTATSSDATNSTSTSPETAATSQPNVLGNTADANSSAASSSDSSDSSSTQQNAPQPGNLPSDNTANNSDTNETPAIPSKFKVGDIVQISASAVSESNGYNLIPHRNWVGKVLSISTVSNGSGYEYMVSFYDGEHNDHVLEQDLSGYSDPVFSVGEKVEIGSYAQNESNGYDLVPHRGWVGIIISQQPFSGSHSFWEYKINFQNGYENDYVLEQDLVPASWEPAAPTISGNDYHVNMSQTNSGSQNDQLLQTALYYASQHPGTNIQLPQGNYSMGAAGPQNLSSTAGNIILSSNTTINGNQTNLIVDGQSIWVGLATGLRAIDGVSNFTMSNLNVKAKDLVNGNFFIVMADHGNNWQVHDNSFTMVNTEGEHIFDLGGIQNSTFSNNKFIGYAPNLKKVARLDMNDGHDYYAEAIQLDASSNNHVWDADYISKIDSDSAEHNAQTQESNNVTISNNQFLPYLDDHGNVLAYSTGVGQHSTPVGNITVTGNLFVNPLVDWVETVWPGHHLAPIHFWSGYNSLNISNNTVIGVFPIPNASAQLVNNQRVVTGSVITAVKYGIRSDGSDDWYIDPNLRIRVTQAGNSLTIVPNSTGRFTFTVPVSWGWDVPNISLYAFSSSADPLNSSDIWQSSMENLALPVATGAKFQVGQQVQIQSFAGTETNGYSLVPRRGWVGTIVSRQPINYSHSQWEYRVTYANGNNNFYVAEQDLTASNWQPSQPAAFQVGTQVQVRSYAQTESNGYNLVPHRNWVGKVTAVRAMKDSNSQYEYSVTYANGQHNDHVLEQDLAASSTPKFQVGQQVQIQSFAGTETNGYSLVPRRGWVGTIVSRQPINYSHSQWEYRVTYANGNNNFYVAEQDLTASNWQPSQPAAFQVGTQVQVRSYAQTESNGYNLVPHRNWVGKVTAVRAMKDSNSQYEYSVTYANGQHNDHVLEQDLQTSQLLVGSVGVSSTQQQWLYSIVNDAVTAANTNDLYASIMLAQAILESGWGTSDLALSPNNNLFGIKANKSQFANGSVNLPTTEYDENGRPYTINADFNTYSSILNSFNDYVDKMVHGLSGESSNRYSNVARSIAGSYAQAAINIQQDGYATDPSYSHLLVSVIENYNLNVLDAN